MPRKKITKWLEKGVFPQRILLSGGEDLAEIALEIAAKLQNCTQEEIEKGIQPDTIFFRDTGKSFKIDFSDTAKRDGQSQHENVRGMIKWAHQKPVSNKRIVILENFERISHDANHALLKLLEEPPINAIFIFTTQNHHKLLDTILSRITVVRVPLLEKDFEIEDEISDFLKGKNLISKFKQIEALDKESKDNPDKKINRKVFINFLEKCVLHARLFNEYHDCLEMILETMQAISSNQNTKFTCERLAIKLTNR
ncbi:MAG: hypothetical protein OEL89_04115 [Candidatus Peregrinibacteria bacterium]|nr:hypothetical protein [Candidatus Peregrinibacteria bacterium]